jgi:hypothetical protein
MAIHLRDRSDGFTARTLCGLNVRDLPRNVDDAAPTCVDCLAEECAREEEAVRRLYDDVEDDFEYDEDRDEYVYVGETFAHVRRGDRRP